ncbi:hypothetical protein LJC56_03665 [Christensenellaceae bacterium OttesenSCG-928-K19]|nr:hypothetical protein [Christensenellaceae bacterium OttesenSCG-928-K19]
MKLKRMVTVCMMTAVLLITTFGISASAETSLQTDTPPETENTESSSISSSGTKNKDEVVYATLDAAGSVDAIYTVNHFSSAKGERITDYGEYDSVVNLTNTDQLTAASGAVSFTSDADNFYYQGNMSSTDLPWLFDISYKLDGSSMAPEDTAGKDGKLELGITSSQNGKTDPTFYENYMLQITVTLDTEKCSNIEAPDATIASAGKNKSIAFTVLPGGDANYTVTTDVQNFSMAGISIAAVPYSMNMDMGDLDMEGQLEDLEKLPEAISELNDGVGKLEDGTSEMKSGANQLASGSSGIKSGLNQISGNSSKLVDGSAKINDALSQIATELGTSDLENLDLSQISQLPDGLSRLSGGLRGLSGGLTKLKDGFTLAYATLDGAIAGIPTIDPTHIGALQIAVQNNTTLEGYLGELTNAYTAAQTVKVIYSQVKAAFDAVGDTVDTMTVTMGTMADTLDETIAEIGGALGNLDGLDKLPDLVSGLAQLSGEYSDFHNGLVGYTSGVQTLASKYSEFDSGISEFNSGVGELNDGIGELYDGTSTLNDEIADLPDLIQDEIDNLKEQYMPSDFEAISFTSSKNTDTGFVQFVLQTAAIEEPEEETQPVEEEAENETFWDRLVSLFTSDDK